MVSRGAKVVLGGALCFASAIIILVHQMQQADRLRLREGVLRDMERQERKRKNMEELKQQIELTRKLQEQRESDVASNWRWKWKALWINISDFLTMKTWPHAYRTLLLQHASSSDQWTDETWYLFFFMKKFCLKWMFMVDVTVRTRKDSKRKHETWLSGSLAENH